MKKVEFDYEYFKQHPETKLETREGSEARFIGKTYLYKQDQLIFEFENNIIGTTID